jgi:hypothetical protein
MISEEPVHPADLGRVSAAGRGFPKPAVTQPLFNFIVKPDPHAAELTTRHAKQFASLISTQTPPPKRSSASWKRFSKTPHRADCRRMCDPLNRGKHPGHFTR